VQVLTGLGNLWILQYKTPANVNILRELVYTELAVQTVEVIFYIWLTYNFFKVSNITPNRYYDWMFTTPTMLITTISYFVFLKYKNKNLDTSNLSIMSIIKRELSTIISVVLLNAAMLYFGFLNEIKKMGTRLAVILGSIAFLAYFYIIYKNYVVGVEGTAGIFYAFFILWSLYGVAALLPYDWKNISYNILDLFSKNFFGVFLTVVLYGYAKN
jgi:bacteriorhodopsin